MFVNYFVQLFPHGYIQNVTENMKGQDGVMDFCVISLLITADVRHTEYITYIINADIFSRHSDFLLHNVIHGITCCPLLGKTLLHVIILYNISARTYLTHAMEANTSEC